MTEHQMDNQTEHEIEITTICRGCLKMILGLVILPDITSKYGRVK